MKHKLFFAAFAALALGACSDKDLVDVSNDPATTGGSMGYVTLSINLPTQPSTKAANDVFDDGTEDEYAVKQVYLYLFAGDSEETATCYAAYEIDPASSFFEPENDQITAKQAFTTKIDKPTTGSNIYAFVALNASGIIGHKDMTDNNRTLEWLTHTATEGVTIDNITGDNNGFYMCNAPLFDEPGGTHNPKTDTDKTGSTGKVSTLVLIDPDNIYDTEAEAEENPAADIYVERGMAKVTVTDDEIESVTTLEGKEEVEEATVVGYILDLTNKSMYPVRNTSFDDGEGSWWSYASGFMASASTDYWRFVGGLEVGADLFRTYWGKDPYYGEYPYTDDSGERSYVIDGTETMNYYYGKDPLATNAADDYKLLELKTRNSDYAPYSSLFTSTDVTTAPVAYCFENTFNVAHMNKAETTRAIVAVQIDLSSTFKDTQTSNDFYIVNDNRSDILLWDEVKKMLLTELMSGDIGYFEDAEALWSPTGTAAGSDMWDYIDVSIEETTSTDKATIKITFDTDGGIIASNFSDSKLPSVFVTDDEDGDYATALEILNSEFEIAYYKDGIAYYPVLIEHFGDTSTPWSSNYDGIGTATEAMEASYPDVTGSHNQVSAEENWLGRWGVLRNNWYQISVKDITDIGTATVPEAYDEPDDPTFSYGLFEINILSWALRPQSVSLQ